MKRGAYGICTEAEGEGAFVSRVGGQLATAVRHAPDRLHIFYIDAKGVLRCCAQGDTGWSDVSLPQADGLPFGTDLHPPGALTTAYQAKAGESRTKNSQTSRLRNRCS